MSEFEEKAWRLLHAYHADGGSFEPARVRKVARDPNGVPNTYNTLLLILEELFPERMAKLRADMEAEGR